MNAYHLFFPEQPESETDLWWSRLRIYRDYLLVKSDWAVLPDAPTNKTAWETYRQELRDLPSKVSDPYNVAFPQPPSGGN